MAGSAVNLTGMLSQINSSLGNMGNTVGQGMFNPMLEIQKEQRAEETRKRLEAEKIAKLRGMQGDITASNNVLQEATMDASSDGRRVGEARKALQEKAAMNPEQAQMYMAQDAKLAQQEVALRQRGHIRGVNAIDKALEDKTLDPAARQAFTERRAQLLQAPGVASAMAAQAQAQRAADLQVGELEIQEHRKKEIKENEQAARLAQIVMAGTDISQLKAKATGVPSTVWKKVDKQVADWAKAQREADKYRNSNKDNTSKFKGTSYEEPYNLLASSIGFEEANNKIGDLIASEATTAGKDQIAAGLEFDKLSTQQKMMATLSAETSVSAWQSFRGTPDDMQRAYAELDDDKEKSEVVDFMTATYQSAMKSGKGPEVATNSAMAAGATALGVKIPESAKENANPLTDLQGMSNAELEAMLMTLLNGENNGTTGSN